MKVATEDKNWLGIILMVIFASIGIVVFQKHPGLTKPLPDSFITHDARQIGNAAQEYFLTTGNKTVSFIYDSVTGEIKGPLTSWVTHIRSGYTLPDTTIELGNPAAFSMSHPKVLNGQPVTFSDEGKTTLDPLR